MVLTMNPQVTVWTRIALTGDPNITTIEYSLTEGGAAIEEVAAEKFDPEKWNST